MNLSFPMTDTDIALMSKATYRIDVSYAKSVNEMHTAVIFLLLELVSTSNIPQSFHKGRRKMWNNRGYQDFKRQTNRRFKPKNLSSLTYMS